MNTPIETSDIASTALDTAGGFVYTTQFGLTTFFKHNVVDGNLLEDLVTEDKYRHLDKFQKEFPSFNTAKLRLCVHKTLKYIEAFPGWEGWPTTAISIPTPIFVRTAYHNLLKGLLFEAISLEQDLRSHGVKVDADTDAEPSWGQGYQDIKDLTKEKVSK